jgi:hypothetical protein
MLAMSLDEGRQSPEGYPAEYTPDTGEAWPRMVRILLISGGVTLFLSWGYFHEWKPALLYQAAPLSAFLFVLLLLCIPGISSKNIVAILPYFSKSHPGVSGGCSFLSGKALARNCVYLDSLAIQSGWKPLSFFGFADDLHSQKLVWHEPEEGFQTISGLRAALCSDPSLLSEADALIAELTLIEANLSEAVRLQAPFCLLLRYGDFASGQEMEARQGYFCYSDSATFPDAACQKP